MGGGPGGPAGATAAGPAGKESAGDKGKGVNLGVQRPGFGGGGQGGTGQGRTVLTMEDLGMAVGEYGVNVKRGEFYR
jgi:transcription initiation factor TFIID subunit 10